ncbi:TPA: GNAT family N-acetyltransferase [Streptococcus suis]|uniref:GNAT family N-acetyltransferase n=1 Tax=Streptococcus suis TaxID=1307 RepID=UPI00155338CE|nr:GNAT family N-acetyltransferase [Streptococcus suis]MCK3975546.1 GNAT family N-acetyltransferase [Streptococcus suis]NQL17558.1 GNAT family N-acetyltransferase [Streptococcus suis]QRA07980.1 GNAT family N-acetyltransferase [Streptococcus suis]QWS31759.1 GNAT family N-acetyltransferase [Streptococcus suis]QXT27968.1 GNAT family N-acetyltransferase [Streptococcus suis]
MKISQFSNRYQVRKLADADLEQVLALYQTNPLYFEHFPPLPSLESLANDLVDCPSGKELSDKYFLGFWDKERLVAILDLIDGYPTEDTAYIGLFMVDSRLAGQGLGSKIIAELLSQLATHFKKVRLGYVESNPQASHFWSKVGFCPTGEVKELAGKTIVIAEYALDEY